MDHIQLTTLFPLERAFRIVTGRAEILLRKRFGCGRRELWILLSITTDGRTQREIGQHLGLHANLMVKLLDGMEASDLLQRSRRPRDRRVQIVEVTAKGKATLEKFLAERPDILEEIFAPLTEAQRRQWRELALEIVRDFEGGGGKSDY